ncbi:MAG: type I-MYXAN CRISPR-associated protein Cas6/Cmx6 [Microcystaceae cyanobacterium]
MFAPDSSPPDPYYDLNFPIIGNQIPYHHAYYLYSAICRRHPQIHNLTTLSIHPINGEPEFPEQNEDNNDKKTILPHPTTHNPQFPELLNLTDTSFLRLRLPASQIPLVYRLAGKTLKLKNHKIRLGIPKSYIIQPANSLYSRLVVIRQCETTEEFLSVATRQLQKRNIEANLTLTTHPNGEPIRRIVVIKGQKIVGFGVKLSDLNPEDSISLQENGLGGRHRLGCGVFIPVDD